MAKKWQFWDNFCLSIPSLKTRTSLKSFSPHFFNQQKQWWHTLILGVYQHVVWTRGSRPYFPGYHLSPTHPSLPSHLVGPLTPVGLYWEGIVPNTASPPRGWVGGEGGGGGVLMLKRWCQCLDSDRKHIEIRVGEGWMRWLNCQVSLWKSYHRSWKIDQKKCLWFYSTIVITHS